MAFRPSYGRLGLIATPYFILFEMVGPVLTIMSYPLLPIAFAFGLVSATFMIAFFVVALLVGQLLSIAALALEEFSFRRQPRWREVARLIWYATVENFGYRQLTDLWRMQGMWDAMRRTSGWGEMTRAGFAPATTGGPAQPDADVVGAGPPAP